VTQQNDEATKHRFDHLFVETFTDTGVRHLRMGHYNEQMFFCVVPRLSTHSSKKSEKRVWRFPPYFDGEKSRREFFDSKGGFAGKGMKFHAAGVYREQSSFYNRYSIGVKLDNPSWVFSRTSAQVLESSKLRRRAVFFPLDSAVYSVPGYDVVCASPQRKESFAAGKEVTRRQHLVFRFKQERLTTFQALFETAYRVHRLHSEALTQVNRTTLKSFFPADFNARYVALVEGASIRGERGRVDRSIEDVTLWHERYGEYTLRETEDFDYRQSLFPKFHEDVGDFEENVLPCIAGRDPGSLKTYSIRPLRLGYVDHSIKEQYGEGGNQRYVFEVEFENGWFAYVAVKGVSEHFMERSLFSVDFGAQLRELLSPEIRFWQEHGLFDLWQSWTHRAQPLLRDLYHRLKTTIDGELSSLMANTRSGYAWRHRVRDYGNRHSPAVIRGEVTCRGQRKTVIYRSGAGFDPDPETLMTCDDVGRFHAFVDTIGYANE
jgi:hypothetical protein